MERLLSLQEVAQWMKVSHWAVRRWIKAGKIPYRKVGGRYRFSREEVEEWSRRNGQEEKP